MKFMTLSVIIIGTLLLLNLAGAIEAPVTGFVSYLYTDIESSDASPLQNLQNTILWTALTTTLLMVGGVSIRAGLYGSAPPLNYFLGTFAVSVLGSAIIIDSISVVNTLWSTGESWVRALTLLIFIPLTFMFLSSLKSYWEGAES